MKFELWMIGKTAEPWIEDGMSQYEKRLKHYVPYERVVIPDVRNTRNRSALQFKEAEGQTVLERLEARDYLILWDEQGKLYDSVAFSERIQAFMNQGHKRVVWLIGGAYGFSDAVYARAQAKIALSPMTFSHQMVRTVVLEQLYRAMTILRGEPYHNS